jgi:predicted glycoside hydrolase/deacetylase ChbG (UPF0249 family)
MHWVVVVRIWGNRAQYCKNDHLNSHLQPHGLVLLILQFQSRESGLAIRNAHAETNQDGDKTTEIKGRPWARGMRGCTHPVVHLGSGFDQIGVNQCRRGLQDATMMMCNVLYPVDG